MDVPFIASAGSIILHSKDNNYPLTHLHGLFSASSLPGPQGFRDEEVPQVTLRGNTLNQPSCIPCQLNCCRTCRESSCTVCLPSVPPLTTFGLRSQCQTNSMMKQRPQRGLFCDSWQWAEKNDFTQEKGLNPSAMCLGIETNIGRFCSSQSSLPCVSLLALLARHSHATLPHVRKKKTHYTNQRIRLLRFSSGYFPRSSVKKLRVGTGWTFSPSRLEVARTAVQQGTAWCSAAVSHRWKMLLLWLWKYSLRVCTNAHMLV